MASQSRILGHLDWLQTELARLNRELQDRLQSHTRWSGQTELLCSVPGVGPVVAAVLVAELPVRGGRASVRRIPCMATMTAICHNPPIRAFYRRLCAKGKPRKVALVAVMHKLLTVFNAVMRDQVPWTMAPLSTAIHT